MGVVREAGRSVHIVYVTRAPDQPPTHSLEASKCSLPKNLHRFLFFFLFYCADRSFTIFSHVWQRLWYSSYAPSRSYSMGNSVWLTFVWIRPGSRLPAAYELTVQGGAPAFFQAGGRSGLTWAAHFLALCRWREESDPCEHDCSVCRMVGAPGG